MAYTEKYSVPFVNYFGKSGELSIQKRDYVGASNELRCQGIELYYNYSEDTPVITSGLDVTLVNTYGFDALNDLLSNKEKEFKAILNYDGSAIWEGYLISDLSEQQVRENAIISLTFSDYLKRLKDTDPLIDSTISDRIMLKDLYSGSFDRIGFGSGLIVNSKIKHFNVSTAVNYKTFIDTTYIEGDRAFKNNIDLQDCYWGMNETLLPFNVNLYYWNKKYYIERYNDFDNLGSWVEYDLQATPFKTSEYVPSDFKRIIKQNKDFLYINNSQTQQYISGLKELHIALNDVPFESLVFNNLTTTNYTLLGASATPLGGSLNERHWYVNSDVSIYDSGYDYDDIKQYVKYSPEGADTGFKGLHYAIKIKFNENDDTDLKIGYKEIFPVINKNFEKLTGRYTVMIASGIHINKFLKLNNDNEIELSDLRYVFEQSTTDDKDLIKGAISVSQTINLDYIKALVEDKLTLYIGFLPASLKEVGGTAYFDVGNIIPTIIGDFNVKTNVEEYDNDYKSETDGDYVNTKDMSLEFFDLNNINISSGFVYADIDVGYSKSYQWTEDNGVTYNTIQDILIDSIFRTRNQTTRSLNADILYNGYLKPLTFLRDNTITRDTVPIDFCITNYRWDIIKGIYSINAFEYINIKNNLI